MRHKFLWLLVVYFIFKLLFFAGASSTPTIPLILWVFICALWYSLPWDEPDMGWRTYCATMGLLHPFKQTKLWRSAKDAPHSKAIVIKVNVLLTPQHIADLTSLNLPNGLKVIDYVHHRKKTFVLICYGPPGTKKRQRKKVKLGSLKPVLTNS